MKSIKIYYLIALITCSAFYIANAADTSHKSAEPEHAHGEEKPDHADEHKDEHGHGHDEEVSEEKEASNIGPDKGVLEASEKKGLRLTSEAIKTLDIQTSSIAAKNSELIIPRLALVESKRERFVYVLADGFYKAFEVISAKKNKDSVQVKLEEKLNTNLAVVVKGAHFLRNIQVDVFSGDEGGHHH